MLGFFGQLKLSCFILATSYSLEQESSGAVDRVTKRAISTPESKYSSDEPASAESLLSHCVSVGAAIRLLLLKEVFY